MSGSAGSTVGFGLSMAVADTRAGLTCTFLLASAGFARKAAAIEATEGIGAGDPSLVEHIGYVAAAVMQSVTALEAESWEITSHGPGHHLGSNGIDVNAQAFLQPLAEMIDGLGVLERYATMLHLLRKPPLDRGAQPSQDADLLVKLRNELTHYKSIWGRESERRKLFTSLKQLNHPRPSFVADGGNFFPRECLSAACAAWAVRTAVSYLNAVYERLGIETPLARYGEVFAALLRTGESE